jgi:hypothetical protein
MWWVVLDLVPPLVCLSAPLVSLPCLLERLWLRPQGKGTSPPPQTPHADMTEHTAGSEGILACGPSPMPADPLSALLCVAVSGRAMCVWCVLCSMPAPNGHKICRYLITPQKTDTHVDTE